MLIKRLLLFPLIALILWMIMAFLVAKDANVSGRRDQLTLGSIGEPDNLNPILSTTAVASEVGSFVFNGLLKYDEHINVVGDLAESYQLTQNSTAFFLSEKEARRALAKLEAARDIWGEIKLQSCRQENDRLILHFEAPHKEAAGTSYEKQLFGIWDPNDLLGVSVMTVVYDPQASLPDGKAVDYAVLHEQLQATAEKLGDVRIHEIVPISEGILSISAVGNVAAFKTALTQLLGQPPKQIGEILESFDQALLNEPIISFRIRPNVRWQDGHPLTSADAAFTYRCLINPQYRSPRAASYWPVKNIQTPDPLSFTVTYRYPFARCLLSWMMPLIPRHILEGHDAQWWADHYNSKPIGTGPYYIEEWIHNEHIRLKAFKDYFEGPPNLQDVLYRIVPDQFVNQIAFDAREFDVNELMPFQVQRYEDDPDFETFRNWSPRYVYIGWNLKKPLFADKRVRVALAHAINVERIIKSVYYGTARQANGIYPFNLWYANKNIKPFDYDPALARQMLTEAGWKPGDDGVLEKDGRKFEFTLITNNGNSKRTAIQMLVQDDLKKIGIKVNTATYEWAVFIKNYIDTQQFDACVLGWNLSYSPDEFDLWHSSQIAPPGLNFVSYSNKEVDRLLLQIRSTFDREEIIPLCHRLQRIIYEDQPYLFLCYEQACYALYKDMYVVRRPNGKGGWIVEPIRDTELGFGVYMTWWAPARLYPHVAKERERQP